MSSVFYQGLLRGGHASASRAKKAAPCCCACICTPVLQNMLQCGYLCLDGEVGDWIAYFREGAG